jgi:hypothetical protein
VPCRQNFIARQIDFSYLIVPSRLGPTMGLSAMSEPGLQ